ncbi:MAG: hypothetical protein RL417_1188 [Pseudomonadota bacterium]|jgi:uncharacterized membrane protein YphA (DoxX/SURF4 family)
MKINEPIGDASIGPLLVRLPVGIYFVLAGLLILRDPTSFLAEVHNMKILPPHAGTIYAIMLPYLQIAAGGLLIIGMWTTLAAGIISLMLLSFVIAFGLHPEGGTLFNKDIVFLAAAVSLLYTGSGAWSVDRFRRTE